MIYNISYIIRSNIAMKLFGNFAPVIEIKSRESHLKCGSGLTLRAS